MLTKVKTITSDNGLENSRLNLLNIKWYVTNAYSWWKKGTIEQKHKQLRKFIPKCKSLNKLNQVIIGIQIGNFTFQKKKKRKNFNLGKILLCYSWIIWIRKKEKLYEKNISCKCTCFINSIGFYFNSKL